MVIRLGARLALAFGAALCATGLCTSASAQAVPRTVLVLHSGSETFPANPILDAGIREALASRPDLSIEYFAEYLEVDVFPGEEATEAFVDYVRRKYQGRRFDVVLAITDSALRFALHHRGTLFSDAPIIFSGLAGPDETSRKSGAGVTGVRAGIAYPETLKLALQLHPSTERVFVVANGRDASTLESVRSEFRDLSSRVSITYLAEETLPHLLEAVRRVPPRSVIIYIWHQQRDAINVIYADEIARLVAEVSPVPVYGTSDFYVGSGVVGGVVRGTRQTGIRLGELAVQILTGTRAEDIPIAAMPVEPFLDWRQLQRWGISEARVPAGTLIRFREPSLWDRYKVYILGAATILLAQTVLISGLLVQGKRRRQAEAQVRESQEALRASYERIRDLGSRMLNAQDAERSRVARELHDDISQQVALLSMDLELLSASVQPAEEELVHGAINRTQGLSKSLHDLSYRLHPAKLRLIGLIPALRGLQRELSRPETVIEFTHENVPPSVPADLTLCLYRIVQESLQNVLKHSRARQVSVQLSGDSQGLALTIVDNGVGFDVEHSWNKGLGLISMRERLEPVGGRLEIRSTPGTGTRLTIHVPLSIP